MQISDDVPTVPCQFVAIWQIDNVVYSDSFRIRKMETDRTDHFFLEIDECGSWQFLSGYQNSTGCKCASMGYWNPSTKFMTPS